MTTGTMAVAVGNGVLVIVGESLGVHTGDIVGDTVIVAGGEFVGEGVRVEVIVGLAV